MGEIKTEKYTILEVSDAEFQIRMEEEKRACLPCMYLVAVIETGEQIPAILLKKPLKNKEAYMKDLDVHSWWFVLSDRTKSIKSVFLKLEYMGAGTLKFCIDLSPRRSSSVREEFREWFQYIISSGGKVAICDGPGPAIGATGLTLEIPRMILEGTL